jgi:hypothetical protein
VVSLFHPAHRRAPRQRLLRSAAIRRQIIETFSNDGLQIMTALFYGKRRLFL